MYINKARKVAALFLCALLLTLTTGCQKTDTPMSAPGSETSTAGFSLIHMPLPDEVALSTAVYCENSSICIGGLSLAGDAVFGKYTDGSFKKYALPEGISYVYGSCSAGDRAVVLAGDYPQFWTDANGNKHINDEQERGIRIIVFSPSGDIDTEIPIHDERVLSQNIRSIRYYKDNFYLLAPHCFVQLDSAGNISNILQKENSTFISQTLTDSGLALCFFDAKADGGDNITKIQILDTSSFHFSDIYSDREQYFSGLGYTADGTYLVNADGALFSMDNSGSMTELFSFSEIGSAQMDFMEIYEFEGDYIATSRNQKFISRITYGELNETRQELRLMAVVNSQAITELVNRFNQSSKDYVVKIEYMGDMSQEQLNALIVSGNGPDIYAMIGMDMFETVRHDAVFEDLYPYLMDDNSYGPEVLLPTLLDASMEDGALYNIPIDFMLWTFCAQKDQLPNGGTDLIKLLDRGAENDMQIFSSNIARDDLWYWISNLYLNNYLDRQTGSVNFETDEFHLLLEHCAKVSEVQSALDDFGIVHLEQIPGILRLQYLHDRYGENYTLNMETGSAFSIQQNLAISALSSNKDGAWQFVREVLSPNFPQSLELCLPATQERFDALIAQGINGTLWNLKESIQITSYDEQELRTLVANTHVLLDAYPDIIQIMQEEAEKFFAGDKSAVKTAESIQSRASIVLAEKYGYS